MSHLYSSMKTNLRLVLWKGFVIHIPHQVFTIGLNIQLACTMLFFFYSNLLECAHYICCYGIGFIIWKSPYNITSSKIPILSWTFDVGNCWSISKHIIIREKTVIISSQDLKLWGSVKKMVVLPDIYLRCL